MTAEEMIREYKSKNINRAPILIDTEIKFVKSQKRFKGFLALVGLGALIGWIWHRG